MQSNRKLMSKAAAKKLMSMLHVRNLSPCQFYHSWMALYFVSSRSVDISIQLSISFFPEAFHLSGLLRHHALYIWRKTEIKMTTATKTDQPFVSRQFPRGDNDFHRRSYQTDPSPYERPRQMCNTCSRTPTQPRYREKCCSPCHQT